MKIRSLRSRRLSWALALVVGLFSFLAAGRIAAQPGETRSAEEIEKDLLGQLARANQEAEKNPPDAGAYEKRGTVYSALYSLGWSRGNNKDEPLAEKGIADFTTAAGLIGDANSTTQAGASALARIFSERAGLRREMWAIERDKRHEKPAAERVDQLLNGPNFAAAAADYSRAAELDADPELPLSALSNLYLARGQNITSQPDLYREVSSRNEEGKVWGSFDEAVKYATRAALGKPYRMYSVFNIYAEKGWAAYKQKKYDIALDAFQSDVKNGGQYYELLCDGTDEDSYCALSKKSTMSLFSFRRALVYMKLGDPQKALVELDAYSDKAVRKDCPQPKFLRLDAYRQLGRAEAAAALEKQLRETPAVSTTGCDILTPY